MKTKPDLKSSLRLYLSRACKNAPIERRKALEAYLLVAIDKWVLLPKSERKSFVQSTIESVQKAMSSPANTFEVKIGLPTRDPAHARSVAKDYLSAMRASLHGAGRRRTSRIDPNQLSFKIGRVSLDHPGLSEVSAYVSSVGLKRKDILRARNHVTPKRGRNPASTRVSNEAALFLFSEFEMAEG